MQYLRTYALTHTTNRIDVELGQRLFGHLLRLPMSYFETRSAGQTVARVNATLRRAVRARGRFPTDEAAPKLLYLVLNRSENAWKRGPREWIMAKAQVCRHLRRALHKGHGGLMFNPPPPHEIPDTPMQGWLYLAVVIDLFARRVVGWATSDRRHKELALAALRRATSRRRAHSPRRLRQPVLLPGLSDRAAATRHPHLHVGQGELLR